MNTPLNKPNQRKTQAEERRLQIMDTSLEMIARKGFEATSIKDIAGAAGISQGLMYHYFSSKQELLKAIIEHYGFLPQLRQILIDNKELPVSTVFKNIANGFLDVLERKHLLVTILIKQVNSNAEVSQAWADLCHDGVGLIQEYLEEHIRRGDLRPHNSEVTARSLFGMMFMFYFTRDVFSSSQVTREVFIEETLKNNLYGFGK